MGPACRARPGVDRRGRLRLCAAATGGRLVFAVEILGDPFGPPAAPVGGRQVTRFEQTLERERDCFSRLWIGLWSANKLHPDGL